MLLSGQYVGVPARCKLNLARKNTMKRNSIKKINCMLIKTNGKAKNRKKTQTGMKAGYSSSFFAPWAAFAGPGGN
jgi:hypothetical protein